MKGTEHLLIEVMAAHHHAHHMQDVRLPETVHLAFVDLGGQSDGGLQQVVHRKGLQVDHLFS